MHSVKVAAMGLGRQAKNIILMGLGFMAVSLAGLPAFAPALADDALESPLFTGEIRLDQKGGLFDGIPVYNQVGGICYAAVATELVDAYRRHTGVDLKSAPFISSPLEAAVEANQRTGGLERDMISGGLVCPVVNSIIDHGSCDISLIEDLITYNYANAVIKPATDQYTLDQKSHPELLDADMKKIMSTSQNWDQLLQLFDVYSDGELRDKLSRSDGRTELATFVAQSMGVKDGKPLNSSMNPATLKILLDHHAEEDDAYKHILSALCGSQIRKPYSNTVGAPQCQDQTQIDFTQISNRLQAGLPTALEICDDFLMDGRGGVTAVDVSQCSADSRHVVVVVGERFNFNSLHQEFLLRNSWGANCYGIKTDIPCESGLGEVWIDSEVLRQNSYAQSWLE